MKKLFALSIVKLGNNKDKERIEILKKACMAFSMKQQSDYLWESESEDFVKQAQGQCADFGLPLSETRIWNKEVD